jgi:hypothetical protein
MANTAKLANTQQKTGAKLGDSALQRAPFNFFDYHFKLHIRNIGRNTGLQKKEWRVNTMRERYMR